MESLIALCAYLLTGYMIQYSSLWPPCSFHSDFMSLVFFSRPLDSRVSTQLPFAQNSSNASSSWAPHIKSAPLTLTDKKFKTNKIPQYIYILHIFYALTLPTMKFSILLMYARLFPTKNFRYAIYTTTFLVLSWVLGVLFAQVLNCVPLSAAWKPAARGNARCIDIERFYYGNGISNLLTDVLILCLPLPIIWRLNTSRNRKVALTWVFLLGNLYACSFSAWEREREVKLLTDVEFV